VPPARRRASPPDRLHARAVPKPIPLAPRPPRAPLAPSPPPASAAQQARTAASLHGLQLWAASGRRAAEQIDAGAAARNLVEGVQTYRRAALDLDVQLRALQRACAAWRAREALGAAALRAGQRATGGGEARAGARGRVRRSAATFADAEAWQSGGTASAAADFETHAPAAAARASEAASGLGQAERFLLERACGANPLDDRAGEGARGLTAIHGALLRYGSALDVAHEQLRPAAG
jgi:hypothetical protein